MQELSKHSKLVRWRRLDGMGLEQLAISEMPEGILANGIIVSDNDGEHFAASYAVELSPQWVFRKVTIKTVDGMRLHLVRDDLGKWSRNGVHLPELDGCVDIDMSMSAFTNSLPIRRAGLIKNQPQQFDMAWIPLNSLNPVRDDQIYTALGDDTYRYQSGDSTFEGEITVDPDGLVLVYQPLFERV